MKDKRGIEFSFGWIFALIVGAAILFLAIYASVKFISSEKVVQETESAKQIENLLTPIEVGYEEGKSVSPIEFKTETRLYNDCSTSGNFGQQSIRISTLFGKKWQEQGFPVKSYNKYIFSPNIMQTKNVSAFSKPFEFPFRVANLLFLWSDKYCFVNPPLEIEEEITDLNLKNINFSEDITKCEKNSKNVCFASNLENCDVVVNSEAKSVTRDGKIMFYEGALIYGAILSEPELYECQVKRLMKRTSELSSVYRDKSILVATRSDGCSGTIQQGLENFADRTGSLESSADLKDILLDAESLDSEHKGMTKCVLWERL